MIPEVQGVLSELQALWDETETRVQRLPPQALIYKQGAGFALEEPCGTTRAKVAAHRDAAAVRLRESRADLLRLVRGGSR
jgi:hypothetical protein